MSRHTGMLCAFSCWPCSHAGLHGTLLAVVIEFDVRCLFLDSVGQAGARAGTCEFTRMRRDRTRHAGARAIAWSYI